MQITSPVLRFAAGFNGAALHERSVAAAAHCLLSTLAAATLAATMLWAWYPQPWFEASGGQRLLTMIVVVDVVIGPLLTFAVFDRRKPRLRIDLAVIAVLQASAFAYGVGAMTASRPVFQTFVVDRFELVSAAEVDPDELAAAPAAFHRLPWGRPMLAAAQRPDDPAERQLLLLAAASGVDLRHRLRHYVPYEQQRAEVLRAARPLSELERHNDPAAVHAALRAFPAIRELRWLPVSALNRDLVALVDGTTAELRGVVKLSPWKP